MLSEWYRRLQIIRSRRTGLQQYHRHSPFLYETVSGTELNKILPMLYLADFTDEYRVAHTKVMVKYVDKCRGAGVIQTMARSLACNSVNATSASPCAEKLATRIDTKAAQPIKNDKSWSSVRQARSVCQTENTSVDLDELRHLEEAAHLELVSLIDTLVRQIHIACQDGANACMNRRREALKAIRHRVQEAYQELL